ncbi:LysM peptidoglycan-binding domain-containing protein [Siminovitchia sediminis]|uniref:LysM peptidoglycan-binding domain-containing protein n=1 Tax=Siminovitchia sediminis TaxID=1274353 RepID=A0ABW4KEK8_9BACI
MRKKIFAFFTGAVMAGAMAGGVSASAATYEVQQGDSLWSISQKHGTTVEELQSLNNLSGNIIFPKQQLHISEPTAGNVDNNKEVYTVKAGDSLWKISQAYGIQVNQLKAWNQLSSDLIHPGQELAVNGTPDSTNAVPAQAAAPAPASVPAPVQKETAQPKPEQPAAPAAQATTADTKAEGKEMTVTATAYTAYCNGCSGVTATGIDLRSNPGQKVIAVDPSVIPLGSKVHVEGYGTAIAGDTGGAIKGNKIDVFVPSKSDALQFGVKKVKITVLNE